MDNLSLIFKKFNQFRKRNKHTDVNICVDGISFPCHRMLLAASCDYFDNLFSRNFRDHKKETIQLKEVDPVAFSEILEFIYTGNVDITGENVSRMLRISDFLGMQQLEKKCTTFICTNYTVNFFPDICTIMTRFPKDTQMRLVEKIISNVGPLLQMDCFLDTPINVMRIIFDVLKQRNSVLLKSPETFYGMLKWYQKNPEERSDFFENIIRAHFHSLPCSSDMLARLVKDNLLSYTKGELEQDSEKSIVVHQENTKNEKLLLYVRATDYQNNKRSVLEVGLDANGKWMESANRMVCPSVDYLKTVFACNKQYFLTYKCDENQFWCNFYDKSSLLKCPPVTFLTYTLAVILEENIYLSGLPVSTPAKDQSWFYYYNIEIDKWFPLEIKEQDQIPFDVKLVSFNDRLLCAFNHYTVKLFDRRTHKWYEVNKNYSTGNYVAGCVNNGHIYLSGVQHEDMKYGCSSSGMGTYQQMVPGKHNAYGFEYNREQQSLLTNSRQCDLLEIDVTNTTFFHNDKTEHILVPFKNRCWSIYRNLQSRIFDPKERAWMSMSPVSENVKLLSDTYRVQELYDAVVSGV